MEKEEEKIQEQTSLGDDFNWDENGDFFGIEGTAVEEKEETKKVDEDVKAEGDTPEAEKKEVGEEKSNETFFEEVSTTEEEDDDKKEKKEKPASKKDTEKTDTTDDIEDEDDKFFTSLTSELQEKGVFSNIELEEDAVINEESFFKLQEEEVDARVEETFQGFFEELDPDAAAFLQYKKEGGSTADFFRIYRQAEETPVYEAEDLDEESNQDRIIKYYAKNVEGMDDDEISDKLDFLADGNKKKAYAEKYNKKLASFNAQNKKKIQANAEQQRVEQEERREEYVNSISDFLEETDEIKKITIAKKEKKDLHSFITKPAVKVGTNKYVTELQAAISDAFKDKEKIVLLAKVLKDDFDFSDIERKAETKKTKKIKSNLQNSKKTQRPSGGSSQKTKQLSDFFN